jgi:hypothetical protein
MPDLIKRIQESADWRAYYSAYADAYREFFQYRLALGRVDLVGQLHHTAIPDASGTTCGMVNWAAYSQPSAPTLSAFLELFSELVKSQPQRIRSSRYVFVIPEGAPFAYAEARQRLGDEGDKIDYWCDSFSTAFAIPEEYGPVDSVNLLVAGEQQLVHREELIELGRMPTPDLGRLRSIRTALLKIQSTQRSVISPILIQPIIDSSFILAAFRLGLTSDDALSLCEGRGGIGAHIARERARDSEWSATCVGYCAALLEKCPTKAIEYVVKPGEMLSRIVRRNYGVSFDRLWPIIRVLNPTIIDPNFIRAGDTLSLPKLD